MKKEIKVTFETITPLWTGDAWEECKDIRPSSLLGSLRFWFEVYYITEILKEEGEIKKFLKNYLDSQGKPQEKLEYEKFRKLFLEELKEVLKNINNDNINLDEIIGNVLQESNISIPSRIFGCTGWKSRIEIKIEDFTKKEIELNNLILNKPINCGRWVNKTLFNNDENKITVFENVKITLKTTEYWWDTYLKPFFEYLKDKIILFGGKKSFGFGFVNLKYIEDKEQQKNEIFPFENEYIYQNTICLENKKPIKNLVLGFNFRYYLREENTIKLFREKNFGNRGESTKIYISNLDLFKKEIRDKLYIFIFKKEEPFDLKNKGIPNDIIRNYVEILKNLNLGE